jgi:hypothetical protein
MELANLIISSLSLLLLLTIGVKAVLVTRRFTQTRNNIQTAIKTAAAMQQKHGSQLRAVKPEEAQG